MKMSPGCKCCGLQATLSGAVVSACTISLGPPSTHSAYNNSSVTVKDTGLTTTYGVLYTDSSGNFSGNVTIPSSPLSVKVVAAIDPTHTLAARYSTVTSSTLTLTAGSITSTGTLLLPAATGYHCMTTFSGGYPLPDTLHLTDSLNGSYSLSWASSDSWSVSANINFPGCSAPDVCASKSNVPCSYAFFQSSGLLTLRLRYRRAVFTNCPDPTNTATFDVSKFVTPTANPFNLSTSAPTGNDWYCNGSNTWTMTE